MKNTGTLVERLRAYAGDEHPLMTEAANAIVALTAKLFEADQENRRLEGGIAEAISRNRATDQALHLALFKRN